MTNKELKNKAVSIEYLAGLIDGEGYVGVRRCTTKGDGSLIPEFKPSLMISGTDMKLMKVLKNNFSGSICRKSRAKKHWKKAYSFEFNRTEIKRVLPRVLPHLIIKEKQAEKVLKLYGTYKHTYPGNGYTEEEILEKEKIHKDLLKLNKRGI